MFRIKKYQLFELMLGLFCR